MSEETIILLFFLFCLILSFFRSSDGKKSNSVNKDEQGKKQMLEDEMNAYGLDEHEKELVRKSEYDVWDFDTEGPFEEDDYYGDDV